MATFVEVNSVEKNCKVIVNLDEIIEIAPLAAGGCVLFFADSAAVNGKSAYPVKDSYEQFKQFAMQTVTADDIARRFPKTVKLDEPPVSKASAKTSKMEIPKL
ncbi:MAG: hypothetical protein EBU90_17000 [Proteobacteria bacterium]|nr:hypothetical protein [Pseudomonadota bacterium]